MRKKSKHIQGKIGLAATFFGKLKISEGEKNRWKEEIKKRRREIEKEFKLRASHTS